MAKDVIVYLAVGLMVLAALVPFGVVATCAGSHVVPDYCAADKRSEAVNVNLGTTPVKVELQGGTLAVDLKRNSTDNPLYVSGSLDVGTTPITVSVPPDAINVTAVVPQGAFVFEVPKPTVVTRVFLAQMSASEPIVVDDEGSIPNIQADSFTILLRRFRPLGFGTSGLKLPRQGELWLRRFREDIAKCQRAEVAVSGGADRTDFLERKAGGNTWEEIRAEAKPSVLSMDDVMNCGLANARAMEAVWTLVAEDGSVAHQWSPASDAIWKWFLKERTAILDVLDETTLPSPNGGDSRLGIDCACKDSTDHLCRARRLYCLLDDLCRESEIVVGSFANLVVTLSTHGCSDRSCSHKDELAGMSAVMSRNVRLDLQSEDGRVGACVVGGDLIADEL